MTPEEQAAHNWLGEAKAVAKYFGPSFKWPSECSFSEAVIEALTEAKRDLAKKMTNAIDSVDSNLIRRTTSNPAFETRMACMAAAVRVCKSEGIELE